MYSYNSAPLLTWLRVLGKSTKTTKEKTITSCEHICIAGVIKKRGIDLEM